MYAKLHGGRWTPRGEFGGLYLNATIAVAAANARHQHRRRAIGLFDLRSEARPHLIEIYVPKRDCVDVVTDEGIAAAGLPGGFPNKVPHSICHSVARQAYANAIEGVASRSAAEVTATSWVGEELTVFDRAASGIVERSTAKFTDWYPDAQPDHGVSPLIVSNRK